MNALLLAMALQGASTPSERLASYFDTLRRADQALVAGELKAARELFERALELSHRNPTVTYGIACAAARAGQGDALYWLGRSVDWGWLDADVARWDPDLESLRSDPRFERQLARMAGPAEAPFDSTVAPTWRLWVGESVLHADAVALTPDGERVLAGCSDGAVHVLDAATGARLSSLEPMEEAVWALTVSPDGQLLAALSHGGNLRFFDLATGHVLATSRAGEPSGWTYPFGTFLDWDPAGTRLVVVRTNGESSLWSRTGDLVARWQLDGLDNDYRARWMPRGTKLLTASGNAVELRAGSTGEVLSRPIACPEPIVVLDLSPDGRTLATGHRDGWTRLWDLERGVERVSVQFVDPLFPEPEDEIAALDFSPDNAELLVSNRQGTFVELRATSTLQLLRQTEFLGAHFGEAMPVRWSPDGSRAWYAFECGGGMLASFARRGKHYEDLALASLPVFARQRGALVSSRGVCVVDPRSARLLWRRIELPDGELIQAPSGHFTSTSKSLEGLALTSSYQRERLPIDARFAELLFDPKRVRAAQAGIPIVAPRLSKD
jgi:WD40 repeat protein